MTRTAMASAVAHEEGSRVGTSRFWNSFVCSRRASVIALGWGFAEATFFFVVPDVWIGLLALFSWRTGLRAVAWAITGALIGGTLMFIVGAQLDRDGTARLLDTVPAISPEMIERVGEKMREGGPASMMLGPLQGTPYKIYAWAAGVQAQPLGAVLLWTIPARGARLVLITVVAALGGFLIRRITPRTGWLLGPYLVAWIVFYASYFRAFGF